MSQKTTITIHDRVAAKPGLVAAPMDKEMVMLDLELGQYFGLDDIAAVIWHQLADPVRVADLCAQLMEQYDVDETMCRADTLAFLNELHAAGLVEVHEPDNG